MKSRKNCYKPEQRHRVQKCVTENSITNLIFHGLLIYRRLASLVFANQHFYNGFAN